MRKVITYSRVSLEKQNVDRQLNDLLELCEEKNWEVDSQFYEKISGYTKQEERKLLYDIIEYCENNSIECVVVSEVSRISRDLVVLHDFLSKMKRRKIDVYIKQFNRSMLNEDGSPNLMSELLIGLVGSIGKLEREITLERMNSGRKEYIRKGGKVGRPKIKKTDDEILLKHNDIKKLLCQGISIRNTSKISGKSIYTIQKVKNILKDKKLVL